MTFADLAIGAQFTKTPSGNSTLYTKISRWRAQYTAVATQGHEVREVFVKMTVTDRAMLVYPRPQWRRAEQPCPTCAGYADCDGLHD